MTIFCDDLTFEDGFVSHHYAILCDLEIYLKCVRQNQLKRVACSCFWYFHDFYDDDSVRDSQQVNPLGCYSFHFLPQSYYPINHLSFYESTFSTRVFGVLFQLISKDVWWFIMINFAYQFFLISSFLKAIISSKNLVININSLFKLVKLHIEVRVPLFLLSQTNGMLDVILVI